MILEMPGASEFAKALGTAGKASSVILIVDLPVSPGWPVSAALVAEKGIYNKVRGSKAGKPNEAAKPKLDLRPLGR